MFVALVPKYRVQIKASFGMNLKLKFVSIFTYFEKFKVSSFIKMDFVKNFQGFIIFSQKYSYC